MEERIIDLLRKMLREQLCCIGRIAARHQVPDDVIWEIVKGFEILYMRACREAGETVSDDATPTPPRKEPHPGLVYLIEKIGRELRGTKGTAEDLVPA